MTVEH